MRIVITGAAGLVGSRIAAELGGSHELVLVDLVRHSNRSIVRADLSHAPAGLRGWKGLFDGADAIVHCSGDPRPDASRRDVLRHNLNATWNVLETAVRHRTKRLIYMSSNWTVRALQEELGPERFCPNGPKIGSEAPLRPLGAYGFSKAASELLGRMFVDESRLETFIAVRLGNFSPGGIPHPTDLVTRSHWISERDLRRLARRCVEAEVSGFHVVYGVSAQPESPFDLSSTKQLLGWEPRDSAPPIHSEAAH